MREEVIASLVCLLLALGALGVAGWALLAGLGADLDGLFLIALCALLALTFALVPLRAIRRGVFRELLERRKRGAPVEKKEQRSAAAAITQESREGS